MIARAEAIDFELECDLVTTTSPLKALHLRNYQLEAIRAVKRGWAEVDIRTQLAVAATGTGKTITFSHMAEDEVRGGGRVLILAHTDELIEQAIEKLTQATGMRAGKEKAGDRASLYDKVVCGSVQTLAGSMRLASWPQNHFTLIICDEAHRSLAASYQKIFAHFFSAKILGVTATADRGDKKELGTFYQRIAFEYGLLPAVRDGWLVRPMVKTVPLQIDLRGLQVTRSAEGADFDKKDIAGRIAPILAAIAIAIQAEAGSRKILIFLPSVETAQLMANAMSAAGIPSEYVSGDCTDRLQKIARYRSGQIRCLCNMALLTEGFDDDSIDCIVILRPTKIRALYAQMVGRGTRPYRTIVQALNRAETAEERRALIAASAKPTLLLLDFLWLYEKHDLVKPASLVSKNPEVMVGATCDGDLIAAAEKAERDFLARIEAEVAKNARRKSKVVDPLTFAAELHDIDLADYEPETARDARPATEKQLSMLVGQGINVSQITCQGQAGLLIGKILNRHTQGLCTIRQLHFLHKLGVDAALMTKKEAAEKITGKLAKWQTATKP
jgi:superfamily II DNA or RNA helicase